MLNSFPFRMPRMRTNVHSCIRPFHYSKTVYLFCWCKDLPVTVVIIKSMNSWSSEWVCWATPLSKDLQVVNWNKLVAPWIVFVFQYSVSASFTRPKKFLASQSDRSKETIFDASASNYWHVALLTVIYFTKPTKTRNRLEILHSGLHSAKDVEFETWLGLASRVVHQHMQLFSIRK